MNRTGLSGLFHVIAISLIALASAAHLSAAAHGAASAAFSLDLRTVAGDVNHDRQVTAADLLLTAQIVSGLQSRTAPQINANAADLNGDGQITDADVTILADYLSERRATVQPESGILRVTSLSASSVRPFDTLRIQYQGTTKDQISDVKVGTTSVLVLNATDTELVIAIPFMQAGDTGVRIATANAVSAARSLTIQMLPAASLSAEELAGAATQGLARVGSSFAAEIVATGALTVQQNEAISRALVLAQPLLDQARRDIERLTPDQRQLLEHALRGAGVLDLFRQASVASTAVPAPRAVARALSPYAMHQVCFRLDSTSFFLSYLEVALDAVVIAAVLSPPPAGQVVAATIHSISKWLGVLKAVCDLLPTDLRSARVSIPAGPFRVGQTIEPRFTGNFIAQTDVFTLGIGKVFGYVLDGRIENAAGLLSKDVADSVKGVGDIVSERLGAAAGDDGFASAFAAFRIPLNDVTLDPSIYRQTLVDAVSLAIPLFPANLVNNFLEKCGVNVSAITLSNPVDISPATVASFSFNGRSLTGSAPGSGTLSFRAFRFGQSQNLLLKLLDLHVRINVPANNEPPFSATFQVSPAAGTITVGSNLASASWTIRGPQTLTGSGSSFSYSNLPAGDYTISWNAVSDYTTPPGETRTVAAGGTASFSGSYSPNVVTGSIRGSVKNFSGATGLSGVTVTFTNANGGFLGSALTDSSGAYSRSIAAGTVTATFAASGYVGTTLTTSIAANGVTNVDAVLVAENRTGNGTVSGVITNAVTGVTISGVSVRLRSGVNTRSGTVVASATTSSSGAYSLNVTSGTYTVEFVASGYTTDYRIVAAQGGSANTGQNFALSPTLPAGQLRIVLQWGRQPPDLDAHLTGPLLTGGRFHVYHRNKAPANAAASLEQDKTSGIGPETITITALRNGEYRFSVYDYTNRRATGSTALSQISSALVIVSNSLGEVQRFSVPTGQSGNLWTVFTVDGATGRITPINTFGSVSDDTGIQSVSPGPQRAAAPAADAGHDAGIIGRALGEKGGQGSDPSRVALSSTVSFSSGRVDARIGEEVTLGLSTPVSATALGAYRIVLRYPAAGIELLGVQNSAGAAMPAPYAGGTIQHSLGRAVVLGYQGSSLVSPAGNVGLFQLRVRAKVAGAFDLKAVVEDLVLADASVIDVPVTSTLIVVAAAPTITAQPQSSATVAAGQAAAFTVAVDGFPAPVFRWQRLAPGAAVWTDLVEAGSYGGVTTARLSIGNPTAAMDGDQFRVVVTNSVASITSAPSVLRVLSSRLINLSVLTGIAAVGDTFTLGYVVGGNGTSGAKPLVIRAGGPSLAQLRVPDVLPDPKLELFAGASKTGENDNWGGASELVSAFVRVGAFPYSSATSRDAAALANVATRDNSVKVTSVGAGTGAVIAEIYEDTPAGGFIATTPRLVNVSVLKHVGSGLTAGFVIGGTGAKSVLVRAVGPTLGAAPFNVPSVVADPRLTLYSGQSVIGANDNWGGTAALTTTFSEVGAFPLPAASRDAALLVSLQPGNYTVQVAGAGGATGVALVEIYEAR
jgi:uncharacterized protein YfaP (DUF2135 family)